MNNILIIVLIIVLIIFYFNFDSNSSSLTNYQTKERFIMIDPNIYSNTQTNSNLYSRYIMPPLSTGTNID